ncbi:uncharacterized protein [Haliotis asinina]|uniref:uncharacterized protein n=1 Tax=Haliotis asinina TaxID=109174 RepID=UPI003531A13F
MYCMPPPQPRTMSCLKIAIVLTFCLQGFPLSGDSDSCLSFNKVNKTYINQGRADSEETGTGASSHRLGSKGDTTDGAVITIAICAVLFVAYKYRKVCVKCLKQLKDKLGSCKFNNSRSGEPAERDPLTSVVEVADSSTKRETPVAQPQSPLHHDVNSQSIDGLPWPQRCEEDMAHNMQGKYSEDDSGQVFHLH